MPRKNVIAQHHRNRIAADERLADDERLRQSVRRRLNSIRQIHAELPSVSQQALKAWRILRRRNNQNIPNARVHQNRHRIVNHRLIVNREQLLTRHLGQRIQARAGTARQNNSLHQTFPFFMHLIRQTRFSFFQMFSCEMQRHLLPFYPWSLYRYLFYLSTYPYLFRARPTKNLPLFNSKKKTKKHLAVV